MSGFFFIILASLSASLSSLITSKSVRQLQGTSGYFTFYFLASLGAALLSNLLFFSDLKFSLPMSVLGSFVGVLLIICMLSLGKAVQQGPAGLSFAFLNSGAIAPPILLALIFKSPFGFTINLQNIVGMVFVMIGLFWAALASKLSVSSKKWFLFALFTFLTQALILTLFQWRILLIQTGFPQHICIPFHCGKNEDFWFMPAMFLTAFLIKTTLFLKNETRAPLKVEILGGLAGGFTNGLTTFLLLLGTTFASDSEKIMLFPLFAALVIIFCNLFGKFLFREKINWIASSLLTLGIFIATLF